MFNENQDLGVLERPEEKENNKDRDVEKQQESMNNGTISKKETRGDRGLENEEQELENQIKQVKSQLEKTLDETDLDKQEKKIIKQFYGLNDHSSRKSKEIAQELGFSESYVCEIRQGVLKNPKNFDLKRQIEEYEPLAKKHKLQETIKQEILISGTGLTLKNILDEAVLNEYLDEREVKIIKLRCGFGDYSPHTFEQIGKKLGIRYSWTYEFYEKTLNKLKGFSLKKLIELNPKGKELEDELEELISKSKSQLEKTLDEADLDKRKKEIIKQFYGLSGYTPRKCGEIAQELGGSSNSISIIKQRILKNPKNFNLKRQIEEYKKLEKKRFDLNELIKRYEALEIIKRYEILKKEKKQLLTQKEENRLVQQIRDGDEEVKGELIEANLHSIVNIAKKYPSKYDLLFSDLIYEGKAGLMEAIKKFNYRHGFKFSTYAMWWIQQRISRFIIDNSPVVCVFEPAIIYRIRQIELAYLNKHGKLPSSRNLAKELNMTLRDVLDAQRFVKEILKKDS